MKKRHHVSVNGEVFRAKTGEVLLDAALLNGIEIPHDCRSGQCGTCLVRVVDGRLFDAKGIDADEVRACQCRIISDIAVVVDETPEVVSRTGHVVSVADVSEDVVEVCIEPSRPMAFLQGQYINVQFRGFPSRSFSPTDPIEERGGSSLICLHVRRFPNGRVSSALGRDIGIGHRVKLTGPFGSAYFRPNPASRTILVSGGTGFAPIWSIAKAALREQPDQEIVLVAGSRTEVFYMRPALRWLGEHPNVTVTCVADAGPVGSDLIRVGRPTEHLPLLSASDTVYVAGPPALVEAISQRCTAAGARCYADAFVASSKDHAGWFKPQLAWLRSIAPRRNHSAHLEA